MALCESKGKVLDTTGVTTSLPLLSGPVAQATSGAPSDLMQVTEDSMGLRVRGLYFSV